jgi:hypothetical protein
MLKIYLGSVRLVNFTVGVSLILANFYGFHNMRRVGVVRVYTL